MPALNPSTIAATSTPLRFTATASTGAVTLLPHRHARRRRRLGRRPHRQRGQPQRHQLRLYSRVLTVAEVADLHATGQ